MRLVMHINAGVCHTLYQSIFNLRQDNMSEDEYDAMSDDNSSRSDNNNAISNTDSARETDDEYQIYPWWPMKKETSQQYINEYSELRQSYV